MINNLVWNVFYYNINQKKITTYNVLNNGFYEYINKAFKKTKTKDEFAESLRKELMYHFWSRSEWELIIEITEDNRIVLKPWCGSRDPEKEKIDVTDDTSFDWKGFAKYHIEKQVYGNEAKIDVYEQVKYVWDDFVEFVWNSKQKGT